MVPWSQLGGYGSLEKLYCFHNTASSGFFLVIIFKATQPHIFCMGEARQGDRVCVGILLGSDMQKTWRGSGSGKWGLSEKWNTFVFLQSLQVWSRNQDALLEISQLKRPAPLTRSHTSPGALTWDNCTTVTLFEEAEDGFLVISTVDASLHSLLQHHGGLGWPKMVRELLDLLLI